MVVPTLAVGTACRELRLNLLKGSGASSAVSRCALLDLVSSAEADRFLQENPCFDKLGSTRPWNALGLGRRLLLLLGGSPDGGSMLGALEANWASLFGSTFFLGAGGFGTPTGASLSSLDLSETADLALDALE